MNRLLAALEIVLVALTLVHLGHGVKISGRVMCHNQSYPDAEVSLLKADEVVLTVTSDKDGNFSLNWDNELSNNHEIQVKQRSPSISGCRRVSPHTIPHYGSGSESLDMGIIRIDIKIGPFFKKDSNCHNELLEPHHTEDRLHSETDKVEVRGTVRCNNKPEINLTVRLFENAEDDQLWAITYTDNNGDFHLTGTKEKAENIKPVVTFNTNCNTKMYCRKTRNYRIPCAHKVAGIYNMGIVNMSVEHGRYVTTDEDCYPQDFQSKM